MVPSIWNTYSNYLIPKVKIVVKVHEVKLTTVEEGNNNTQVNR